MRDGNYTDAIWSKNTGKTVEELNSEWKEELKKQLAEPTPGRG